jgi:excinuclease ABC subunit A
LPRDRLVVITGLSGSGKSSLAFDTIYAEGQRRYVESLSAYARQFLELMQKPDVDSIEGLSPAISIEQKTTSRNPRSTVGTVTEIYDYMRLLWARVGVPYSPATGLPIESQTVSQMVDRILAMPEGTRLYLLAPIVRGRKGEYRKELQELQKRGFQRVKVDGKLYEIDEVPALDKKRKHDIEVVVDRSSSPELGNRLADSIETALGLGDGLVFVENADGGERHVFSSKFACPVSGFTIAEIEPRLFSFNNPYGACPACDGLGTKLYFDPELVVPDPRASLRDGADRAVGLIRPRPTTRRRSTASRGTSSSACDAVARAARSRSGDHPPSAAASEAVDDATTTACASTDRPSRSRA